MMSLEEKVLIFEYWFRVLIAEDISIGVISKIAAEFAHEYEMFIESLSCGNVSIEKDGKVLTANRTTHCQAFGVAIAIPGRKYNWRIKIIELSKCLNLGVIKSDTDVSKASNNNPFWVEKAGYAYYSYIQ